MADEIPPAPSELEDASKAETIRITLPPKQEQQALKRETVRINLPGRPASVPPTGIAPKKETTKMTGAAAAAGAAQPPTDEVPLPTPRSLPTPPRPPAPPSAPGLPQKPLAGPTPQRPPMPGARPTVPLKPAPAPVPGPGGGATPNPIPLPTQKAAAPKKETARITLPAEGGPAKPALPKATVKMQQTQPLVNRPAPSLTPAAGVTTALQTPAPVAAEADGTMNILAYAALAVSLASLAVVYMVFSSASAVQ